MTGDFGINEPRAAIHVRILSAAMYVVTCISALTSSGYE